MGADSGYKVTTFRPTAVEYRPREITVMLVTSTLREGGMLQRIELDAPISRARDLPEFKLPNVYRDLDRTAPRGPKQRFRKSSKAGW